MSPNRRYEGPTLVVIDKYSKSSSCDNNGECKEQMRNHLQIKKELKTPHGMRAVTRNREKIEDFLRESGTHLESGGRITL